MVAIEEVAAPCGEADVHPQTATAAVPLYHTVWLEKREGREVGQKGELRIRNQRMSRGRPVFQGTGLNGWLVSACRLFTGED